MKTEGLKQKCLNCLQLEDDKLILKDLQQPFEKKEEFSLKNLQQSLEKEEESLLKDLQKTNNNINIYINNWLERVQIHQDKCRELEYTNVIPLFPNKETDNSLDNNVLSSITTYSLKEEDHVDPINVIKETYNESEEDYISSLNVIQTEDNNFEENYYLEKNSEENIEEIIQLYNYKQEEKDLFNTNFEEDPYEEISENDLFSENISVVEEEYIDLEENPD